MRIITFFLCFIFIMMEISCVFHGGSLSNGVLLEIDEKTEKLLKECHDKYLIASPAEKISIIDRICEVGSKNNLDLREYIRALFLSRCKKEQVLVPGGKYILKLSEKYAPVETDIRSFFIDKYEVTNEKYYTFIKVMNILAPDHWAPDWEDKHPPEGKENYPVSGISWLEAKAYCNWLGFRLPNELEWECAAKTEPETHIILFRKNIEKLSEQGSVPGVTSDFSDTREVGLGKANPIGLYDMYGNAWEMCRNNYLPRRSYNTILNTPKRKGYYAHLQISGDLIAGTDIIMKGWGCVSSESYDYDEELGGGHAIKFNIPYPYKNAIGFRCIRYK